MSKGFRSAITILGLSVMIAALAGCNDDPTSSSSGTSSAASTPVISGSPARAVKAGARYQFQPTVNAQATTPLRFAIANRPGWAEFDTNTGSLTGTPRAADARVFPNIVITASAGSTSTALPAFSIEVLATGATSDDSAALALSGSPAAQATVGAAYSFTPTVSGRERHRHPFGHRRQRE
jgi:hypothetical protein